jgi:predicted choloylglycine hydrolase
MLRVVYVGEISSCGGVNAAGLAYVGASIMTRDNDWDGLPLCALTRYLLAECATVDDAVCALRCRPVINHSFNALLADASGQTVVVERLPHAVGVRRPEGDALFGTNHTRCSETSPFYSASSDFYMNSVARFERLATVLSHVPRTFDGLASVLKSHDGPGAICQHGQAGLYSTFSVICCPVDRAIHVTDSCPCQTGYQLYTL